MGRLIQIAHDDETREWQATDPDTRETYESYYTLRVIPQSVQREIRRKHTTASFVKGVRVESLDGGKFTDDCLDYAIVSWRGVTGRNRSTGAITDLPCTREYKLAQPEWIKAEIIRMCLGRELGQMVGTDVIDISSNGDGDSPLALTGPTEKGAIPAESLTAPRS